jgi:hypothetical protein
MVFDNKEKMQRKEHGAYRFTKALEINDLLK